MRTDELCKLTTKDIQKEGNILLVNIPEDNKTQVDRSFTISKKKSLGIIEKYSKLRPKSAENNDRFFLQYKNNSCTANVIGKNTFSQMPRKIAEFLGLEEPKSYTGHSFRRTSASSLANKGGSMDEIQNLGGWKSATVAKGYVDHSISYKLNTENRVTSWEEPCLDESSLNNENQIVFIDDYVNNESLVNIEFQPDSMCNNQVPIVHHVNEQYEDSTVFLQDVSNPPGNNEINIFEESDNSTADTVQKPGNFTRPADFFSHCVFNNSTITINLNNK